MAVVLRTKRRDRRWYAEPPKDPLFVPYPILAKFHRSTLAFEDFKTRMSLSGWKFEFANRFPNSTNVNYLNFHFVELPPSFGSVRIAVLFGKFQVSTVEKIFEHYEFAPMLFFHASVCDDLDYLRILYGIHFFVDSPKFGTDDADMMMIATSDVMLNSYLMYFDEPEPIALYKWMCAWFSWDGIVETRLFSVRKRVRRGKELGKTMWKSPVKIVKRNQIAR